MEKLPFDVGVALERIEEAVRPWPKAALFQLAEEGYTSTFEQLLACIISIRTYDEVTLPVSRTLFARARTPSEVGQLSWEALDKLISPSTFHERKAHQILAIARQVRERFGETLPGDRDVLLSFAGVGPKCANLVLGVACGTPVLSVDIHVHRVTERWGYVQASTPGEDLIGAGAEAAGAVLDRYQSLAGAVREARLYGESAEVFDVSGGGYVQAGGGGRTSVSR